MADQNIELSAAAMRWPLRCLPVAVRSTAREGLAALVQPSDLLISCALSRKMLRNRRNCAVEGSPQLQAGDAASCTKKSAEMLEVTDTDLHRRNLARCSFAQPARSAKSLRQDARIAKLLNSVSPRKMTLTRGRCGCRFREWHTSSTACFSLNTLFVSFSQILHSASAH